MNPTLAAYFAALVEAFEQCEPDLNARQTAILICVSLCHDQSVKDLAERTGLGKPVITRAVDKLQSCGLATCHRNQSDERLVNINITGAGREYLERYTARIRRIAA